jgi:hypothetical protein
MSNTFKTNESVWLTNTYAIAEQFYASIVELCSEAGVEPKNLPPSVISTDSLFNLAVAFKTIFDELQHRDLINIGAIKENRNIH